MEGQIVSKALTKQEAAMLPTVGDNKSGLVVKTKNCVADDKIQANIHYAVTRMKNWLVQTDIHDYTAVFCSGGPSLENHLDELRKASRRKKTLIFCVKHSHDLLIEHNIIPFGCVLLDPRAHVQDFIENPHPKITYFLASMCDPSTIDRLIDRGARYFAYHAIVGAGEMDVVKSRQSENQFLLNGGCSAATRGIAILHSLGFRKFRLYGYDLCYAEQPDLTEKTKSGEPKYFEVEVLGKRFWTDAEKVAQCQDFTKLMKEELDIEVYGEGMAGHVWRTGRKVMPKFEDVYV